MYHELLNTIRERAKDCGELLQPPASGELLSKLRLQAKEELSYDVPDEYAEFLSANNGLDWNGLVVYATHRTPIIGYSDRFIEGFVQGNLDYREFEPMKDFLIFADDGDCLYAYCISEGQFQVITTVGLSVLFKVARFDELLVNALEGHL